MGDNHVLIGNGRFVELNPAIESQGLGNVDLHVVDEIATPDRLEKAIGKPEGENVLRRLLAQEMVDAKDLALSERLVQLGVERNRTVEVISERLLHDDARTLHKVGGPEHVDHLERRLWGNA